MSYSVVVTYNGDDGEPYSQSVIRGIQHYKVADAVLVDIEVGMCLTGKTGTIFLFETAENTILVSRLVTSI